MSDYYGELCDIADSAVSMGHFGTREQAIAKMAHDPEFADLFDEVRKEEIEPKLVRKAAPKLHINLAWDVITKRASELVDAGEAPTVHQAIAKVAKAHPDLYAWYRECETISAR